MGVRGLTSFIARHAEIYLKPYELHDCNLVIDGDNLACNLYGDVTGIYSAFGGDYDDFYRAIVEFFHVLEECNIHAYVLMDGGYEPRKLRTVNKRLRGKISVIKRINPCASITLFPLHMKEVFIDAVRDCGVPVMRCIFEADDELAALGRKLNCPVLSYDSDFYIHNVRYIPLITLTVRAHTKRAKDMDGGDNGDADAMANDKRCLRKSEAKHFEKRTKSQKIISGIQVDNVEKKMPKQGKTYKYLDCCIYRVEHLCGRGVLSESKLPLFAALLGNDYIARSAFKNFFVAGMGKAGRSRKMKQQQRRIRSILKWLRTETTETALEKILSRLKKQQRESLQAQVQAAISGYSNELCHSYDYFAKQYKEEMHQFVNTETDENSVDEDECDEEIISQCSSEEDEVEGVEPAEEKESEIQANEQKTSQPDDISNDSSDEEEVEAEDDDDEEVIDKTEWFPQWFLDKLYPAHLSRFFVDLLYLRKYINNPQIEHFTHTECNQLALPILNYTFALLNNVKGEETQPQKDEDGNPLPIEFTYLTRKVKVNNIEYIRCPIDVLPKYSFEPNSPDTRHLRVIFDKMPDLDTKMLFTRIDELPADLRLYFLAIVYWLHKSQHCDMLHLHALIICLVVLRTIDPTIPAERELKTFHKRFDKIIKKERLVRDKEALDGVKRTVKPSLLELTIPVRMAHVPKSDCYLVQERLLPHFHMQEIFKKKFDLYSTNVLHAFAEFQSVVYQLNGLNGLLDFPHKNPRMGQLYCGVLLYNLYDLLRTRIDVKYYVEHFIFPDSVLMFDFYNYLMDWCMSFVPIWKRLQVQASLKLVNRKLAKKQRQTERKNAAKEAAGTQANYDPNAEQLESVAHEEEDDDDEFFDLNNKFCALKAS